jgi:spermidine/putrescine transport system permease protein
LTALGNSLLVGAAAVVLCLAIGVPTAFALDRYQFPGKVVFRRLVLLPITLPGLITGISMLNFFSMMDVSLSLATVMVGHGTALTAIVVTNVYARLQRFDRRIEEASSDLGARPWQTFVKVTLPNIRNALIGSSLISFTLSFDEIPVTFFLTGRDNTLPMYIWSTIRRGMTPEINAIGSVIVGVSILLLLVSVFLMSDSAKKAGKSR